MHAYFLFLTNATMMTTTPAIIAKAIVPIDSNNALPILNPSTSQKIKNCPKQYKQMSKSVVRKDQSFFIPTTMSTINTTVNTP